MKIFLSFIVFVFAINFSYAQVIYNWNTCPARLLSGTIFSSPAGNNMSVAITTVDATGWITSSPTYTTGNARNRITIKFKLGKFMIIYKCCDDIFKCIVWPSHI